MPEKTNTIIKFLEENNTEITEEQIDWDQDYINHKIQYQGNIKLSGFHSWQIENSMLQRGADVADLYGLFILENGYALNTDHNSVTFYKLSDEQLKELTMVLI